MNLYKLHTDPKSLKHHHHHHETVPELIWDKYKNNKEELKKKEGILATDPWCAFLYTKEVLHGSFPAGEQTISKNSYIALFYAENVLHGRFPAAEEEIASDPYGAREYATNIIKGPWTFEGKTYMPFPPRAKYN
jgi:hypothetical protein